MSKGLTERAKQIFATLGPEEARRCRAPKVAPEHIALAIMREGGGSACHILRSLNVDMDDMYKYITRKVGQMRNGATPGDIPQSSKITTLLDDATEDAHALGNQYVGTEHLLLAMIRMNGIVARYLHKCGVIHSTVQDFISKKNSIQSDRVPVSAVVDKHARKKYFPHATSPHRGTATLDEYTTDLTKIAREQAIDPVIGREREVRRIVHILARRNKNNPILIGEPGVGKTAIVEGLAQLIVSENAPEILHNTRILSLDLPAVVAGTKYRGEFEERIRRLMKETKGNKNVILFIDEVHTLIGAGGAEGAIDAANMFKPLMSRGEIQCIGATTLNEYKKHIERDHALERRFQPIVVDEPTISETIEILKGIKGKYEEFHGVRYEPRALEVAAEYAKRYITERFLPDNAIDVIDEAGARCRVTEGSPPKQILLLQRDIDRLDKEKIASVNEQNYEHAAAIRDEAHNLRLELEHQKHAWRARLRSQRNTVGENEILEIISEMSSVPLSQLATDEQRRLAAMEEELQARVIGQREAIHQICGAIRTARVGLHAPDQPVGSFIFMGPTGVGKTLLAKELALFLFGSHESLVRIDMSDYMEKHAVSRLVGAPPGYVGYNEGGILTEKVRRKPYSVVLFDEIEKAHADFFNVLLQVLEEGELQDNLGHTVSFRNTILVMTSNIGSNLAAAPPVGFHAPSEGDAYKNMRATMIKQLKQDFQAEFINRVDHITCFAPLTVESLDHIFTLLVKACRVRLGKRGITITIPKRVRQFLINVANDGLQGARPLRRVISRYIEEPISLRLVEGSIHDGDDLVASKQGDEIVFNRKQRSGHDGRAVPPPAVSSHRSPHASPNASPSALPTASPTASPSASSGASSADTNASLSAREGDIAL